MRAFRAIFLAVLSMGLALAAAADQSDTRLDGLFSGLLGAGSPAEAAPLEQQIWTIWHEHDDRAINLLMTKGISAMNRRDPRKALEVFDQVVKIAPEFAEGWNKRATVQYMLQNFDASLFDIEKTLALEPRHFGALSGRGLVYAAKEELELAIGSFEAALEVNPQMIGPRVNAEALRQRLKDREI